MLHQHPPHTGSMTVFNVYLVWSRPCFSSWPASCSGGTRRRASASWPSPRRNDPTRRTRRCELPLLLPTTKSHCFYRPIEMSRCIYCIYCLLFNTVTVCHLFKTDKNKTRYDFQRSTLFLHVSCAGVLFHEVRTRQHDSNGRQHIPAVITPALQLWLTKMFV